MAVTAFGAGAGAIAFWTVARFPHFGPRTVTGALGTAVAAFLLQTPLLRLMPPAWEAFGVGGALLLVVLPSLTLLFWTCGCLVRSLVSLATPYRR